jgi:hypothetical protein
MADKTITTVIPEPTKASRLTFSYAHDGEAGNRRFTLSAFNADEEKPVAVVSASASGDEISEEQAAAIDALIGMFLPGALAGAKFITPEEATEMTFAAAAPFLPKP